MIANRMERKKEIPCKSLPNLCTGVDCEGESVLNPYALEFVPSYMKNSIKDMKTEATSTTTLVKREIVGVATNLNTQSQLFELLHQLGDRCMPLKAIKVSLALDGQGVNIQFKADHGVFDKQLDENNCQDVALNLELGERTLMPRKLPNVLAANFMVRMGDILHNKMEWNDHKICQDRSILNNKYDTDCKRTMSNHTSSLGNDMHKVHKLSMSAPCEITRDLEQNKFYEPILAKRHRVTLPKTSLASKIPAPVGDWNELIPVSISSENETTIAEIKSETNHEKPTKGIPTPRRSLNRIKKGLTGTQKFAPRSTFTSQMRQTEAQKRLSLLKTVSK